MGVRVANNASATLAASITSTATSITVQSGQGALFPTISAGQFFYATLVDASNNLEIVKVSARATDTLTVTRAQDGTTARAYAAGDKVELRLVAAVFSEMIQRDGSVDFTGQITIPQGTASGKAINADRAINTSANLTGGGNLTADRTLDLSDTGVGAGSVGSATAIPVLTIDAKGRITAKGTAALDLSTKANTNGSNASGTWPISVSGTSAGAPWSGISGRPSYLSEFINNLGNYGGFLNGVFNNNCAGNCGNCSFNRLTSIERSGNSVYGQINCACQCAC